MITLLVVASQVPGHLRRVHHMVDHPDTAVLSLAVTALILLTSPDGTTYPRRSAPIYILGVAGAVLIGVFALAGRRATGRQVPVLPHGRFRGDDPRHAPALADGCGLRNAAGRGLHARAGQWASACHADAGHYRAERYAAQRTGLATSGATSAMVRLPLTTGPWPGNPH